MEGQRLILPNGRILEGARAGLADGFLWLWIPGITMAQGAEIAFDPTALQHIIYQYGDMEDYFDGYTVCRNLMDYGDEIAIRLVKG